MIFTSILHSNGRCKPFTIDLFDLLLQVRLRLGMYSVYIKDWIKVFPRSQILIISLEDYAQHTRKILNQVYSFLDVRKLFLDLCLYFFALL